MNQKVKDPNRGSLASRILIYTALIFMSLFTLYPLVYVIAAAFTPGDSIGNMSIIPLADGFTLEHFTYLFTQTNYFKWFKNTLIIAAGTALTTVVVCSLSAYIFSRYTHYFDNCLKYGAKFDVIGSSYYPFWTEKTVKEAEDFFITITERYNCPVMVMETGYNWNPTRPGGWSGQLYDNGCYDDIYESSPEGQRDFMIDLFRALKNVKGGMVLGDLYWDPIFVEQPGVGWALFENWGTADANVVSNTTLFDFDHVALPVLNAYKYNSNGVDYALLSGKIVGQTDGTPIAFTKAEVKLGENTYTVTTDSCGGFLLHVPAGEMAVSVTAEGLNTVGAEETVAMTLGEVTKITVQVQGGSISGKVLDDSNQGVPNTVITAVSDQYSLTVTSGENGSYSLTDLPEGSYTVSCEAEGYRVDTQPFTESMTVGAKAENKDIQTTLTSGTLHGNLVDGNGKPLAGATVSAWCEEYTLQTTTDENGEYTIPFAPAGYTYTVQGYMNTYESVENTFEVTVGQTTETGEYVLVQALGTLSGTVTDRTGAPVADALVTALNDSGLEYTATTDANGRYDLGSVLVGSYSISAVKTGLVTGSIQNVQVTLGTHTDADPFVMPEPVTIQNYSLSGRCMDGIGGKRSRGCMDTFYPRKDRGVWRSGRRLDQRSLYMEPDGYLQPLWLHHRYR